MISDYINPFIFFISLYIGFFIVYITTPLPDIIVKYPTPENIDYTIYKKLDKGCYKYNAKEVKCPINKNKLSVIPI